MLRNSLGQWGQRLGLPWPECFWAPQQQASQGWPSLAAAFLLYPTLGIAAATDPPFSLLLLSCSRPVVPRHLVWLTPWRDSWDALLRQRNHEGQVWGIYLLQGLGHRAKPACEIFLLHGFASSPEDCLNPPSAPWRILSAFWNLRGARAS